MKEKRRDSKGRILHTGESQRTDGKYLYKCLNTFEHFMMKYRDSEKQACYSSSY